MSQNPFGGIQPVELPFSGTTDANGKYVFTSQIRAAFWSIVKITGLSAGNPTWLLEVGGNPGAVGLGPQAELGPAIVGPGEKVVLTVSSALPNTTVRGSFNGIQGTSLQDIAAHFSPTPNTLSIQQSAPQVRLNPGGTVVAANATVDLSFNLPPGTHSVAITSGFGPGFISQISIQGNNTRTYGNVLPQNPDPWPYYQPVLAEDTAINFHVVMTAGGSVTLYFLAILNPQAVIVIPGRVPWGVNLQDGGGSNIGVDTLGGAGNGSLLVSLKNAAPAPWQAPSSILKIDDAAGSLPVTKIAGVALQFIYLHHVSLYLDAATDGIAIQDTSATTLWRTGVTGTVFEIPFGGAKLAVGTGLVLGHLAGTTNLKGKIAYTQAP